MGVGGAEEEGYRSGAPDVQLAARAGRGDDSHDPRIGVRVHPIAATVTVHVGLGRLGRR